MGKSAVAELLRRRNVPVIDTDQLARDVVEPSQPALAEIAARLGPEVIGPDGTLKRDILADKVFSQPEARQALEQIVHPRIRTLWRRQMGLWRAHGHDLAVVVIPLLFETGAEKELDLTLCVGCSADSQRQRLLARGWSLDAVRRRISAQWPAEKKMELSTFVIWAEGGLDVSAAQLDTVLRRL